MKIIGKTNDGFIIQASKTEVANIIGFYSEYDNDYGKNKPEIGTEIRLHDMYAQLYTLANHQKELGNIAVRLEDYAKTLRIIEPIINKMVTEVKEDEHATVNSDNQ